MKIAACIIFIGIQFFILTLNSFAQSKQLDSLQTALKSAKEDTSTVNSLNYLSLQYRISGEYEKSIFHAAKALELAEKLHDKKGISTANCQMGDAFAEQGNFEKGIEYYLKAMKIKEEIKDFVGIGKLYHNIGTIYLDQGNKDKALENFKKSLTLFTETKSVLDMAKSNIGIGIVFSNSGNYDKALEHYFKALDIYNETMDKQGYAATYINIGDIYSQRGNYKLALESFFKALKIKTEIADKRGIVISNINIGTVYLKQKEYEQSNVFLTRALTLAEEIGYRVGKKEIYSQMASLYEMQNNFKEAYKFQTLFSELKDSLLNETNSKQIAEMTAKYESEKKEAENQKLLQQNKIQALSLTNRNYLTVGLLAFLVLILGFGFLIFRQNKLKSQQVATQFEQKLLRTQMNPHFIFNSLAGIESFIYDHQPKEAGVYLSKFSRLMRLILENSTLEYITLEKEIEILNYYLSLQKLRLDDKLSYVIETDKEIDREQISIPPMLLQPFIENAIEHGFMGNKSDGHIQIGFKLGNGVLSVMIVDNGIGIEQAKQQKDMHKMHKSMAIQITRERLKHLNKTKKKKLAFTIADLSNEQNGLTGTKIVFSIPV